MKKHKKTKIVLNLLLVCVIVGIILYIMKNSLKEIFEQIGNTNPLLLFLVCGLGFAFLIIEGWNYRRIVQPFKKKLSFWDSFYAYCYVAFYRVITFGTGTIIAEVMYLKKSGVVLSQRMGIASVHMVLYKMAVLIMGVFGLLLEYRQIYQKTPYMIIGVIVGIVATVVVISFILLLTANQKFHQGLFALLEKVIKSESFRIKLKEMSEQIVSLRSAVRLLLLDRSSVVKLLGINLLKLIPWYSIPYFTLRGSHDVSFILVISLVSMASVLAGVIPSPAGIGSFDFVFVLLFTPFVGKIDAASALLLYRFASYVLPFLLGMIYTGRLKKEDIQADFHELKEIDT